MSIPAINPLVPLSISRDLDVKVEFWWGGNAPQPGVVAVDTGNLISVQGTQETAPLTDLYVGGKAIIQSCKIVLANKDKRYSTWNVQSPIYNDIKDGGYYQTKVRVSVQEGTGGSWVPLFTGFIKLPKERYSESQVSFEVWDLGEILRKRYSTPMLHDFREHEVVAHYLGNVAGLIDGTDFVSQAYTAAHPLVPATIDIGGAIIPFSWLDDEPVWDELADLAQASNATVFVDRAGRVNFRKGWRWASPPAGGTITMSDYSSLSIGYQDFQQYDEIRTSYATRRLGYRNTLLWELPEHKLILPGKTEIIEARFSYPALFVYGVAGLFYTLYGRNVTSGCTIRHDDTITNGYVASPQAQQATLLVQNTTAEPVVLPKLRIKGVPIFGTPSEQVKKKIGTMNTGRRMEVRDNPYIQSKVQAQGVVDFLAWWYAEPKTVYSLDGLRGNVNLEVGQAVNVEMNSTVVSGDSYTTISRNMIVTRVQWNLRALSNRLQYTQTLELVENVFNISPGYFTLDTNNPTQNYKVW